MNIDYVRYRLNYMRDELQRADARAEYDPQQMNEYMQELLSWNERLLATLVLYGVLPKSADL